MTKSTLEFFDDPYDVYRHMREQAPVYYSEQYDFYALARHEDVAAAYKDYETYSSAYGVDHRRTSDFSSSWIRRTIGTCEAS